MLPSLGQYFNGGCSYLECANMMIEAYAVRDKLEERSELILDKIGLKLLVDSGGETRRLMTTLIGNALVLVDLYDIGAAH